LPVLVAHLQKAPPLWSHKALLAIPDLGEYHSAVAQRAAEASDGILTPGGGTARPNLASARPAAASPTAAVWGGPLSAMTLHNAMAATVNCTVEWMDVEAQPTAKYPDWNNWLWCGDITAGSDSGQMKVADYAAHVPNSPINKGDTVWIYVWVAGGSDLDGSKLTSYQFTYDPGSTKQAAFVASGTTTINSLSVQSYQ
jgi:hypothetical protein